MSLLRITEVLGLYKSIEVSSFPSLVTLSTSTDSKAMHSHQYNNSSYSFIKHLASHTISIKHRVSPNEGRDDVEVDSNVSHGATSTNEAIHEASYEETQQKK